MKICIIKDCEAILQRVNKKGSIDEYVVNFYSGQVYDNIEKMTSGHYYDGIFFSEIIFNDGTYFFLEDDCYEIKE